MKKIMLLGCVLLMSVSLIHAQKNEGIEFTEGTFVEVLKEAAAQDKLVFVDIYTTWCGPCKMMAADVFSQAVVGEYFNPKFISMKIDAEKGEGVALARKYGVTAYPTFLLLDADGKMVGKVIGGGTAADFIKRIDEVYRKKK